MGVGLPGSQNEALDLFAVEMYNGFRVPRSDGCVPCGRGGMQEAR
jgi:hypothetical protein